MNDWQTIDTVPPFQFDADNWFKNGPSYMVWVGYPTIAWYAYTKTGKGRWQHYLGNCNPTHWMPLPTKPEGI